MIALFGIVFMAFVVGGVSYENSGSGSDDKRCVQEEIRKRECHSIMDGDTVIDVCHDRTDHVKVTCGE